MYIASQVLLGAGNNLSCYEPLVPRGLQLVPREFQSLVPAGLCLGEKTQQALCESDEKAASEVEAPLSQVLVWAHGLEQTLTLTQESCA